MTKKKKEVKEGFRACMQPKEEIGEPIKEKREGSLPQHERGRRNPRYQAVVGGLDQWSKMEKLREEEEGR